MSRSWNLKNLNPNQCTFHCDYSMIKFDPVKPTLNLNELVTVSSTWWSSSYHRDIRKESLRCFSISCPSRKPVVMLQVNHFVKWKVMSSTNQVPHASLPMSIMSRETWRETPPDVRYYESKKYRFLCTPTTAVTCTVSSKFYVTTKSCTLLLSYWHGHSSQNGHKVKPSAPLYFSVQYPSRHSYWLINQHIAHCTSCGHLLFSLEFNPIMSTASRFSILLLCITMKRAKTWEPPHITVDFVSVMYHGN